MADNESIIGLSMDSYKVADKGLTHTVKNVVCVFDTFYCGMPGTFGESNTQSPFKVGEVYEIDHNNMHSPRHIPMKGYRGSYPAYMFKVAELFATEATPKAE